MLTPGTAASDDPIRVAMANKQSKHQVPVKNASPSLVSNGFDEAIQFHLSDDFVVNAEEDGQVVKVDEATGFIIVRYDSGRNHAFNIKPEIVKNSGGGFFLSNSLLPVVKMGQKFKKDEVLAYHDKYFRYSKLNGLRYAIGPLVKIAFISTYNTYEDAGLCTEKLADSIRTSIVYPVDAPLVKTTNIIHMVKVGDKVAVGDALLKYDVTYDDSEITKFMNNLSSDTAKENIMDESRSDVEAHQAGTIVKIEVISLHDPSNLSPSLGKVVQQYFDEGNNKKRLLEEYDSTPGTVKAGYLLTDSTEPHVSRYNRIKHYKGKDVVITFYIEHEDVAGIGDKVAIYGANKNIISEKIKKGYEPYSEHRPEEEISIITSPGTIARRMTSSVLPVSMAMKCMVELKRKIAADIKF
jgi:DNA-directed RNA polymerase beta subunit